MINKILVTFLVSLLFMAYDFGLSTTFAQHEGHIMPKEKQEVKAKKTAPQKKIYYCPMHPTYTSDKPGDCPICNMTLVPKDGEEPAAQEVPQGAVKIDFYKQQLIGVKTDKVIYRPLARVIMTVGRVAFDPELYKAQQEYIEAVKVLEKIKQSPQPDIIQRTKALVEAASLKLELNGLSRQQIEELAKNLENDQTLLISSEDAQNTWVYATIYEYELDWVKVGQEAKIKVTSYPDREFPGKIVAIDPVFDAMTRSVRARIKTDNQQGLLKPNMYVDVELRSDLGEHLAIPKEAVMDSGTRKIVFIAQGDGYFKPVEVKTGLSTEEYVQIVEGLKEDDLVVTSGNFLIDSESKLKSALEGTGHKPEGDGLASDSQSHQHSQ